MIPLNRKERYLNQIVGWGNTAPEKPLTPEEFFFSAILGEDVQLPDLKNATIYELFLAKIAGININISPPTYTSPRIEFFLARAAGMNVPELVPLTCEEIFWSNYVAVVEKILEGLPPLTYKAKKAGTLTDYRIYGQTSRNLLYKRIANANIYSTGQIITEQQNDVMIAKVSSGETYTVNGVEGVLGFFENEPVFGSYTYNNSRTLVGGGQIQYTFTVPSGCNYVGIRTISGATNVMLNSGSSPIPYEPYGESVGDRTGNLFDGEVEQGTINTSGAAISAENRVRTTFYNRKLSAGTYTISANGVNGVCVMAYITSEQSSYDSSESVTSWPSLPHTFTLSSDRFVRFIFKERENNADIPITPSDISNIMLNSGSTALPYEPYGYRVPVTVTNDNNSQTTNIYLPEQIRKVGDEAEYIDFNQQKQHRVRKNLLQNTSGSSTIFGVTYTVNDDGSITCNTDENGATRDSFYYPMGITLPSFAGKTIILSGGTTNIYVRAYHYQGNNTISSNGNDTEPFTMEQGFIDIYVPIGTVLNNVTIFPMARLATIADDTYEPYITNTELDVTLPALPTVAGTNVLSVGTEVQPSNVYIEYEGVRGE